MKRFFTTTCIGAALASSLALKAQDSLFISELIDPADDYTGRFIELFNAGSEDIDFSTTTCYLSRQSNGGTTWGDLQLTGTVAAGNTFVIGGSGFEALYGRAPDLESGILIGNGDDAYCLFLDGDHSTGSLHDIFGAIDVDGTGELWEYEDSRAVRVENVWQPNTTWTSAEWEIYPANVADGDPGTHQGSVPEDPISSGGFSLSIGSDTLAWGQPVDAAVLVSELTLADNIISYQFDVDFDTTSLEFSGFTLEGTLAEGGTVLVNPGIAGKLSVGYMNTNPIVGSGEILVLGFTSLIPDTTELVISNAYLNSQPVLDLTPGTLVIAETAPPTAVITYSDSVNRYTDTLLITATFSEPMAAENPVRFSLSGATTFTDAEMSRLSETVYNYLFPIPKAAGEVTVTLSSGTDLWGNAVVPDPLDGNTFTITEFVPGDVNDDGMIQAYDAALALQYSVGIDPLPDEDPMPWESWRDSTANVDGTGGITANDAGLILQYSAGIISSFPSGSAAKAAVAYVSLELMAGYVVFYSHGELLGLNINTENEEGILGPPEIMKDGIMSAINTNGTDYRIGLCTATSAREGEALLRIPFQAGGQVTFELIENTVKSEVTVDLVTAVEESAGSEVEVFPNPVDELLYISGLTGPAISRIYNIHGQLLRTTPLEAYAGELDLSGLPAGLYVIRLETGTQRVVKRFLKR